jgi:hypothetical protein
LIVHENAHDTEFWRFEEDETIELPVRIQEHKARGTVINAVGDQLGILNYWAHGCLSFQIGFSAHDGNMQIEYWALTRLDPAEGAMEAYLRIIAEKALALLGPAAQFTHRS